MRASNDFQNSIRTTVLLILAAGVSLASMPAKRRTCRQPKIGTRRQWKTRRWSRCRRNDGYADIKDLELDWSQLNVDFSP